MKKKTQPELWRQIVALENKDRLSAADRDELAQLRCDYYRAQADEDAK